MYGRAFDEEVLDIVRARAPFPRRGATFQSMDFLGHRFFITIAQVILKVARRCQIAS